jgi:hypothetical protein
MLLQNATSAANLMIRDKAQHEVMGTYFSNVATQGCFLLYKNRVRGPKGATPCANLDCYKISDDNNYNFNFMPRISAQFALLILHFWVAWAYTAEFKLKA